LPQILKTMKVAINILSLIIVLTVCVRCDQPEKQQFVKIMGEAQGTYYMVSYYDSKGRDFEEEVAKILKDFDMSASLWEPNSVISKINRNDEGAAPDEVFLALFEMSKVIYEKSLGAFDPTVGQLVNAWGFGFKNGIPVDQTVADSLLEFTGFDKVNLDNGVIFKPDPGIQFDFNAIAQGFSVDLIGEFLKSEGITSYLVDVGGEVLGSGVKPDGEHWKVGIEKPSDNSQYGADLKAIVKLEDKAIATSGNYRKFYEKEGVKYSHTIDPSTGFPVQHTLLSVSVLANNCAMADAWATAFMVMGLEKSFEIMAKETELEAYFIYSEPGSDLLKTFATPGFDEIMMKEND
jgi:FAD:protein FMN transferase